MARATTTNQQINGTTTVAKNLTNFSMAGWIRRPSSSSLQFFGFSESGTSHRTDFTYNTDNRVYFVVSNGSLAFGTTNQNLTGWHHLAFTFDGSQSGNSNRLKGYFDGVAQTLSFTGTIPATTSNNALVDTLRIGRYASQNLWSTGDFAELGMWQASLTAAEIASLAKGMTCEKICPQSLVFYTPLIREIQDLARGMTLTDTSTTVAAHPRVYA
jgi:hypothetical protein